MEYFKLFTNCKIVKGANRALMMDLQTEKAELIPLDLYEITEILESGKTIAQLKALYADENSIEEYIEYLIAKDYGFRCGFEDFALFPPIDFKYDVPNAITNAIIELDTIDALEDIVGQLNKLGCVYLSIIKYTPVTMSEINEVNKILAQNRMVSYEIHGRYDETLSPQLVNDLGRLYNTKMISLNLHGSPMDKSLPLGEIGSFEVNYIESEITDFKHCGIVNVKNFRVNMLNVSESLSHNSCLNKKLSVDKSGNIKNCPATAQSFGNIKDTTLQEAINHPDFKKYWNITKDQIDVCKDCEFRHICTDCRAFTEEPGNLYSKPLKCGYSPYTNQWSAWSTNPLKQKAIAFYNMPELNKKDVQISKL